MLILALDTATPWGSVALSEGEDTIFEIGLKAGKGGGEYLLSLLDLFFQKAGRKIEEVRLIAAGTGPGSYTGIRVGLAAVAGLAEGLQIPVYGMNTLRIIAENARYGPEWVAVAMDARHQEVYAALYRQKDGDFQEVIPPQATQAEQFAARLGEVGNVMLCGDAGKRYREIWLHQPQVRLSPGAWDRPAAGLAADLARREWRSDITSEKPGLFPAYLKKVEAEIRLEENTSGDKGNADAHGGSRRSAGD